MEAEPLSTSVAGAPADVATLAGFADLARRTAANQAAIRDAIRADEREAERPR